MNVVEQVGRIHFEGNITPISWFEHILRDNGKPYTIAIVLLSEIVYWYRPSVIRDETTGEAIGLKKKFKADKLQRSYESFANQFGFTKRQVKDALKALETLGIIDLDFRHIETRDKRRIPNVLFIGLNPTVLKEITYIKRLVSDEKTPHISPKSGSYPTLKGDTNTEITTENTTETTSSPEKQIGGEQKGEDDERTGIRNDIEDHADSSGDRRNRRDNLDDDSVNDHDIESVLSVVNELETEEGDDDGKFEGSSRAHDTGGGLRSNLRRNRGDNKPKHADRLADNSHNSRFDDILADNDSDRVDGGFGAETESAESGGGNLLDSKSLERSNPQSSDGNTPIAEGNAYTQHKTAAVSDKTSQNEGGDNEVGGGAKKTKATQIEQATVSLARSVPLEEESMQQTTRRPSPKIGETKGGDENEAQEPILGLAGRTCANDETGGRVGGKGKLNGQTQGASEHRGGSNRHGDFVENTEPPPWSSLVPTRTPAAEHLFENSDWNGYFPDKDLRAKFEEQERTVGLTRMLNIVNWAIRKKEQGTLYGNILEAIINNAIANPEKPPDFTPPEAAEDGIIELTLW